MDLALYDLRTSFTGRLHRLIISIAQSPRLLSLSYSAFSTTIFRQLSKLPVKNKKFDSAYVDSPREADTYETKLRDGDIILAYVSFILIHLF